MPGLSSTIRKNRSPLGSTRTKKESLTENKTIGVNTSKTTLTIDDIIVKAAGFRYPIEDEVPAGYYYSTVEDIRIRTKNGKDMIDVCYAIEGYDYKNKGKKFRMKQTYVIGSDYCQKFYDAMVDAGVRDGASLRDAIGAEECIHLAYVSDHSELGSIIARRGCRDDPEPEDDETEDDDLLSDDDE